jgi:hypothetical protein
LGYPISQISQAFPIHSPSASSLVVPCRPPPTSPPTGANEAPERARAPQRARHLGSKCSFQDPRLEQNQKIHGFLMDLDGFNGKNDGEIEWILRWIL